MPTFFAPLAQSVERRTVNPQVVGSSPTGGANKTTVFLMKAVVFLTFWDIMKCLDFTLWVSFGSMGQKIAFMPSSGAALLQYTQMPLLCFLL